jgi:hypothetical protein
MKKTIILAFLGLTAAAATSYGQGTIAFDTYDAGPGSAGIITTYGAGNGALSGTGLGKTFTGVLLWSTVNIPDQASTSLTAGLPITAGWNYGPTYTFATGSAPVAGFLLSPQNLVISSAVGQTLYFEIAAYNGAAYGSSTIQGHSATFTATLVTGQTLPSGQQLNNLQSFSAFSVVPEPATMALAGLGGLASLVMLRRKKA